ncbi:MAG: serine/threonine-protein kinase, partial [Deltaproteobacteria bacterium]|nr:serine/threonine-protein kinase [Deltaproteobacteria bacterium]
MDTDPLFQEIDKKYSLVKKIGGGSFSEVYLVSSPQGTTALKLLKKVPLAARQLEILSDFKSEFSILKNLNHPNIARILDFGFDANLERYYFTTEWVDGKDLFASTEGATIETILERMVQALRALEYLHASKIFHFDLKAANVLVRTDDAVKVIDFGLASIDPTGKMIGTPTYMAPEIINRERPDGRADLYSLGVLFYYCLTRQNPFRGNGVQETLKRQQMFSPPPPSLANPKIPLFLDRIVMHLLQKNPADRYQRASEVIRDINRELPNKFAMETRETLLSYLPEEGQLIGRSRELALLKNLFTTVYKENGGTPS